MSFYPLFYIICLSNIESAISFASQKIYKKAIQALSSMSRWLPMGRDPRVIDRAIGQLSYSPFKNFTQVFLNDDLPDFIGTLSSRRLSGSYSPKLVSYQLTVEKTKTINLKFSITH